MVKRSEWFRSFGKASSCGDVVTRGFSYAIATSTPVEMTLRRKGSGDRHLVMGNARVRFDLVIGKQYDQNVFDGDDAVSNGLRPTLLSKRGLL